VEHLDFRTTVGYGDGPHDRDRLGLRGKGPTAVVTDLAVLEPDPETRELTLTQVHPGVTVGQVREQTGWDLSVTGSPAQTPPPTEEELEALRELLSR
jgi:acyl CoA:acetate/3-ketoacid CoA transferase beta subunit